ncbi:hypothetical protein QOZ80_3BG0270950 [Eleusine coracana subsp. coracana]|nr:hypothetical protein QOZ80_3BG0270950 [Eleusine coracana subsp. coracana]
MPTNERVNASQKKLFERKPNMQRKDNCTYRRKQIYTSTGHDKLEPSRPTAEHENSILRKCGDTSNDMRNTGASISSEHIDHDNPVRCQVSTTSTSLEDSTQNIPAENISLESDNYEAPLRGHYILSRTSYLSEAQKERVMAFIQETKPKITVFVSVIGKSSVQPPGPYLGISKEYAFAYFPHESTKEGDLCLLEPTKDEGRSTFTVYLLRASATHATSGNDFQRVGPYPGQSIAKIVSEVNIKEEPTNAKHVSSERVMHVISHESPESEDSDDPIPIPYIVPCRHDLSKSQKKIVEERVRAIRSEVPIYVTVMKNNNAGAAQRWMLELGVRYAAEYLPATGETMVLQRMGKTWNTQMNEMKLTMEVHVISREQF